MSPTDDSGLRAFHASVIVPAAEALREAGIAPLSMGPTPAATWYVPHDRTLPQLMEYDGDLGRHLEARWSSQGLLALVDLARAIGDLAARLEPDVPEQSADVSPFTYVLY